MNRSSILRSGWPLLLATALCLSSCKAIMMKAYGIKNPEVETEKTIRKSALKYGLDTSNIATLKPEDFLAHITKGSPDAAFYDHDGNYIEYRATDTSCNAGVFGFIPQLKKDTVFPKTDKPKLDQELARFQNLRAAPYLPTTDANSDYTMLLYWTVYEGRLNKDHVKAWQDLAAKNTRAHIRVILVNMDMQENWGKEALDKLATRFQKK